jgi:hypothetical protein
MISLAIISHHHNGLYDIISPDGKDVFEVRINPKREIFYDEVLKKLLMIKRYSPMISIAQLRK